jgi:hypothetical protein
VARALDRLFFEIAVSAARAAKQVATNQCIQEKFPEEFLAKRASSVQKLRSERQVD